MADRDFTTTSMIMADDHRLSGGVDPKPGLLAVVPMALSRWTPRQWSAAALGTVVVGAIIGLSTVLIPNQWFGREIDSVAWNYPVWIIVSALSGMLFATYVQPRKSPTDGNLAGNGPIDDEGIAASASDPPVDDPGPHRSEDPSGYPEEGRESRLGMVGVVLGWFAVGCPVCNKIALIALGYTGALRWFAPFQPVLAVTAVALSAAALLLRLRGQIWCPVPRAPTS